MDKKIRLLAMAALLLIAVYTMAGCSSGSDSGQSSAAEGVLPGNLAPDFQLMDLNGQNVVLSELRGSPVLLNFWATWCGPCKVEMPLIQEIHEDSDWSEQGLVMLAVDGGETASKVQDFMNANGLSFTALLDNNNSVFKNYNIRAIPTTFFIDKKGIIKVVKMGTFRSREQIEDSLKQLVD